MDKKRKFNMGIRKYTQTIFGVVLVISLIATVGYAFQECNRQLERIADATTLSSEATDYMASVVFELQDRKNILHRESFERKVERK